MWFKPKYYEGLSIYGLNSFMRILVVCFLFALECIWTGLGIERKTGFEKFWLQNRLITLFDAVFVVHLFSFTTEIQHSVIKMYLRPRTLAASAAQRARMCITAIRTVQKNCIASICYFTWTNTKIVSNSSNLMLCRSLNNTKIGCCPAPFSICALCIVSLFHALQFQSNHRQNAIEADPNIQHQFHTQFSNFI